MSTKRRGALATVKRFISDERGLETIEYAIIAGLIVAGTVTTIGAIGVWVSGKFTTLESALSPE